MNRLPILGLFALLSVTCVLPASAAAIVYTDQASFVAATGATLHPLPAGVGGTYVSGASITTTDGVLTLSQSGGLSLFSNWEAYPGIGVSRLGGPDLAISGHEHLDAAVLLGADRHAFGFGIFEPTNADITGCNTTCADSTFTITLFDNGVAIAPAFTLSPTNNVAVFWGVHTSFAFDAVQIRETTGSNDNEIFGTFYTGRTTVPEPATLLLLGAGLAGLGARARRRD